MIALISIPHQTPAKIHWYDAPEDIINDAAEHVGADQAPFHGFEDAVRDAAHTLADDWHSFILVRNADDVQTVRDYTGHQNHRIASLVDDLVDAFCK